MEFAKKILNKYGWKEGDGLGKRRDGIAKPLKASLKFDSAGFGTNQAASDFNNHWWERVFNEAAVNLKVQKQKDGTISVDLEDHEQSVEISTKGYSIKKLKKAKADRDNNVDRYNNFLQTATLTNAGDEVERPDKIELTDIALTQFKALTDEELFHACGGRTAHKGARHGLKLSGKLARLERQEEELLAKMLSKQGKSTVVEIEKLEASAKYKYVENKVKSKKETKRQVAQEQFKETALVKDKRKIAEGESIIDETKGVHCVSKEIIKKKKRNRKNDEIGTEVSKKCKKKNNQKY